MSGTCIAAKSDFHLVLSRRLCTLTPPAPAISRQGRAVVEMLHIQVHTGRQLQEPSVHGCCGPLIEDTHAQGTRAKASLICVLGHFSHERREVTRLAMNASRATACVECMPRPPASPAKDACTQLSSGRGCQSADSRRADIPASNRRSRCSDTRSPLHARDSQPCCRSGNTSATRARQGVSLAPNE